MLYAFLLVAMRDLLSAMDVIVMTGVSNTVSAFRDNWIAALAGHHSRTAQSVNHADSTHAVGSGGIIIQKKTVCKEAQQLGIAAVSQSASTNT